MWHVLSLLCLREKVSEKGKQEPIPAEPHLLEELLKLAWTLLTLLSRYSGALSTNCRQVPSANVARLGPTS